MRCDCDGMVLTKEGESEIRVVICRLQAGHAAVERDRRGHVVRINHSGGEPQNLAHSVGPPLGLPNAHVKFAQQHVESRHGVIMAAAAFYPTTPSF